MMVSFTMIISIIWLENIIENSKILFDVNVFSRATFNVGHYSQYSSENLWFWIVSLFSYTFRSAKILNYLVIFISSLNIYLIYIFGKKFFFFENWFDYSILIRIYAV